MILAACVPSSLISEWSQLPAHSRIPTSGPVRVIIVTSPLSSPLCSGPAVHRSAVDSVRMARLARAMVITLLPPLPGVKRSSRSSLASHWSVQANAGLWLVETRLVAPLSLVVLYRPGNEKTRQHWTSTKMMDGLETDAIMEANYHKWSGRFCDVPSLQWKQYRHIPSQQQILLSHWTMDNLQYEHLHKLLLTLYNVNIIYSITWTMWDERNTCFGSCEWYKYFTRLFDLYIINHNQIKSITYRS